MQNLTSLFAPRKTEIATDCIIALVACSTIVIIAEWYGRKQLARKMQETTDSAK